MSDTQANPPGFIVILNRKGAVFHALVPELEGCHAEGITREAALENARQAIRGHLDAHGATSRKNVWLETIRVEVPRRRKA